MKKYKPVIIIFAVLLTICCILAISSRSIIRGLRTDGKYGPDIFSFEKREVDTIANGEVAFHFPVGKPADWIDTTHFSNAPHQCEYMTFGEAFDAESNTQGVLIIHNDSIVYERYWGDFSADRLATVFSVSKSITSLLCGIAVDDGYIHSIDDPVTDYLPELKKKNPMWQKLTIRHLLDMKSGLDFDDTYDLNWKELKYLNAMAKLNYGHDIMKQIRGLRFRCEPGTQRRYESMTSAILGVVIERASGKRYADYLSEKVWKPLGMESPALVNIDSRKHDVAHAFGGITLTIKDLAKIGRLYLNNGMWDGKRIVSEEWIQQTIAFDESTIGYHFNWYNINYENFTRPEYSGYYALGICEQVLYVNPYKNLIMVRIGLHNNGWTIIPVLFEQLSGSWELCNNDEKSIQIMCEDIHSQYPEATLQDVYKTCYQDYFGAEHLMSDTAAAQQYLQSEFEECRHTDMSLMPKREPTGFRHRFTRINLACVVDRELTEEQLLALFIDAASKDNAFGDAWAEEWQKIERIALRVCPDWANEPLQTELRLAAEGNHAVRHSEAFRKAYNPHYRIVRAE